ncbi:MULTISPECIES: glycosyltransferase family 1 protein [Pseudomonas]|jgi:alpha-1,6-mannosyltransferase|uniref:Glycosyltransferase family 1 protein n=1 Tax=Pseudomonas qingdaonensis TaxID=2056231 RepID=A0ABX8DNX0_9PSED|nr:MULTISPECIES: glycosyltransferase family 1 protein [Pseudomonas]MCO7504167.1 glycosyltransferase family 1 protein [Pseudomonas sp. VE 267-6A]MCO7531882.1 glycosyltransferase family 1 protein [Pseudomonas sp. 2]MCP8346854.1 glycosyltransferase family 1 protein [Pseudomonas sp. FBF18]MCQ0165846.1 glycosyltransferase family 1 protein [Pseudomonas sp. S12(2018)]MDD1955924.1 glycosyltransferase family 1 protein [Pseudomonas sp. 8209]
MLIVHIADITMFYAPASGGVRTYLDAKHRRLGLNPGVRHSLLIPGASASHANGIYQVPAPALPFGNGYRFPLRLAPWRNVLHDLQPDLIEVGDPYLTAWAALDARRQLDVPVIGFYHSDLPLLVGNRMGHWFTPNVEAYVSKLYGNFDRVLAPSQVMADKLRGLGIGNVHVQRLGVDLQTFHPDHRDPGLRAELGLADTTRLLVFAGRGSREKNLPVLLDCMKRLGKHYHLLLVGSHMPSNVPANVTIINHFCPATQVARLLASADALLHAGDQETFGLVILEAMASGIPVVAVAAGAFTEIVEPGYGRLCTPNDGQAMAAAVRELFEAGAPQLGQQARRHAEQHYAWDTVVGGLLEHYRAVLGHHEQPVRAHA